LDLLLHGTRELNLNLTYEQTVQFEFYYRELIRWNKLMNLTSVTTYEQVQTKHFLDSLTAIPCIAHNAPSQCRLLDIGSGAGFPGIPIKLMKPNYSVSLIESVGKKVDFLNYIVATLKLNDINVYKGRAEELAHQKDLRESFNIVISRGVAKLQTLVELMLPYCLIGGTAIALKKGNVANEIDEASSAINTLGGLNKSIDKVDIENLKDDRLVVSIQKISHTPMKYPRKSGIPRKRPL